MLLNVVKAKNNEGTEQKLDILFEVEPEILSERLCKFLTPIHVVGTLCYKNEELFLKSNAEVKLLCRCDNCGKEFEKVFKFGINEKFVENYNSHSEEDYVINQGSIVIDRAIIDNLLLSFPSRMLCKPNCKGLCPICGKDKNKYTCSCESLRKEEERMESPFNNLRGDIQNGSSKNEGK